MRLPFAGQVGRRLRAALLIVALLAASLTALTRSSLVVPAILLVSIVVAWDRLALAADLRHLAAAVGVAEGDDAKLEVADGAWGELCHALNRLLQQRRAESQLRYLLPALPASGTARLSELRPPPEGLACDIAVLAVGQAGIAGDEVAGLREIAYVALHQAELYDALLARWGEGVILIFGAVGSQGPGAALRGAHEAARAIGAAWAVALPGQSRRLSLAAGRGRLVVLPGLGLTVVGAPVEQAMTLQELAHPASMPPAFGAPLLCNEDAYLGLRRQGVIPPIELPPGPMRTASRPTAFAIPLA
jgi:hypothetical protein